MRWSTSTRGQWYINDIGSVQWYQNHMASVGSVRWRKERRWKRSSVLRFSFAKPMPPSGLKLQKLSRRRDDRNSRETRENLDADATPREERKKNEKKEKERKEKKKNEKRHSTTIPSLNALHRRVSTVGSDRRNENATSATLQISRNRITNF